MSLHLITVPAFAQGLANLDAWLQEAVQYAEQRGFEPDVLLTCRLAPDQFDLSRQIQSTCDTAKLTCARVAGVDAPKHEDGPATIDELRARIADVRAYILALDPAAMDAAEHRRYAPYFMPGKDIAFPYYVREFALPNFYFHLTTAYSILRHNGVKLGKQAFIGHMSLVDIAPETPAPS